MASSSSRDSRFEPSGTTSKGRGKGIKRSHAILNGLEATSVDISSDFMCPVCLDLINEAHMTICGHTFCRRCIKTCIDEQKRCPKCTFVICNSDKIFPNHMVNQSIMKYKRSLDLKKSLKQKSKKSAFFELKNYLTTDVSLGMDDLSEMILLLKERKHHVESQSKYARYELMKTFLSELNERKEQQLANLEKEKNLIQLDLEGVDTYLSSLDDYSSQASSKSCSVPNTHNLSLCDIDNDVASTSEGLESKPFYEEGFNVPNPIVSKIKEQSSLSSKKSRMRLHFEELTDFYLNLRVPHFNSEYKDDSPLDKFGSCISKFTQYSSMRPLATIDAGDGNQASSNIASSIEFDKDSEYFAVAGLTKKIRLFDYSSVVCNTVDIHYPSGEMICDSKISCVSWSSYEKSILVSSDYDGTVTVWDSFNTQKLRVYKEHQKRCWSVDFNKMDIKVVASGSDDSKVKLWHLDSERSAFSLEAKANVCCVQFNPCSTYHLAFGSADHCVHYYDLRNPKEALKIFQGHKKAVSYVKFISKEEIVSASTDSQLKIWNVNDSNCVQSLHGHTNEKNFVGLATDGEYVACGSENNALYVYYKELPKKLFNFRFDQRRIFLDQDTKEEESNDFVSAVCWRKGSDVVAAGNSQGVIKILQMV